MVSVVQNAGAPTVNASARQNTNAPAANVSAAQNTNAPAANVSPSQNTNTPAPRSDRPPEVRALSARDPSSKLVPDSPGGPIHDGSLLAEPSNQPFRRATRLRLVMCRTGPWLTRLLSSASIRFLMFFCTGIAVTLAWQSYSDAGREAITNWCGRWTLQAGPAAKSVSSISEDLVSVSPELLKTTSLNLAAVRESIDKLAAEFAKLQTVEKLAAEFTRLQAVERGAPDKTAAPSPLASGLPPASRPPPPRAPQAH
jgi:hypothetical protein